MFDIIMLERILKNEKVTINLTDHLISLKKSTDSKLSLIMFTNIFIMWSIIKLDRLRASQIKELREELEKIKKGD